MEIRNIVDPLYHEILRAPPRAALKYLATDGKELILASATRVYVLLPSSSSYRVRSITWRPCAEAALDTRPGHVAVAQV